MRKLAWAAAGFALGAGLTEYILPTQGLPYIAAALVLLCPAALLLKSNLNRKRIWICALAAAFGLAAWWGRYMVKTGPAESFVGQTVQISAVSTDYVERHDNYERVQVRIREGARPGKALLYFYEGQLPDLTPGDAFQAEVKLTSALTRRGERSHLYTSQGQDTLGYIQPDTLTVTGRAPGSWIYFPQRLSQAVKELVDRLFPAGSAPFVKALLTGDSTGLEEDAANYTAMRTAGVLHIVAVSGMHMFVLVTFLQLLLGRSRRTNLLCLPILWLFALMAGWRASVVRAAVMQTLYLLAPVFRRESDGPTCLGAAALLLLLVNPMAIGGVGLQLSFACMAGMVCLLPPMLAWAGRRLPMHNRAVAFVVDDLVCTIGATALSLPVSALYFGQVPLLSPAANLLTLFPAEIVFAGGYVSCAVGALFPAAGTAMAWLLGWIVKWCMAVYRAVASLPFAGLWAGSVPTVLFLVFVYAAFCLWFLARKRRRKIRVDVPICLSLMALGLTLLAGKLAIPAGQARFTALDVDQGECVILADSQCAVAVDCGGSALDNAGDTAANYLQSIGRTRLDMLVLTHLHADHANSAETLLYRTKVDRLVLPAAADDGDALLAPILAAADARGTEVVTLSEPKTMTVGDLSLDLLLPEAGTDLNEQGIVVLAHALDTDALVMGDAGEEAERALLRDGAVPDVDILAVGHHGSKTASGALFLRAAQPETAVISVGYNSFGQPAEETLSRLDTYGAQVRRTDLDGNIIIKLREGGPEDGR